MALAAFLGRIAACANQFSLILRCLNPTALGFHPPDKPGAFSFRLTRSPPHQVCSAVRAQACVISFPALLQLWAHESG